VSLVGLLIVVIVLGLLIYCVQLLPLPAPFKTIALVIVILIAIVWLLNASGILSGAPVLRVR